MSELLAARTQMGISLGFHIIFAVIGIGMPVLMVLAERRWLVTGDRIYLELARRWSKGTAILFAVGAVSGTVLSFELGLLWPRFMELAGPIIGMPFSLEGFAFFTEAIFLGVYLYGWDKVSPRAHLWAGILVAVSGALSGIFVVLANAWMNEPVGFTLVGQVFADIDPLHALRTPAGPSQVVHMTLAAYAATGFAVAGVHALHLLFEPANAFSRRALRVALLVGVPAALLQPLSGDLSARHIATHQPAKLAAAEALFASRAYAPLTIGGWPDMAVDETRYGIEIPGLLSLMAFHDPSAEVTGLDRYPRADWPNVPVVHLAFQIMIGLGTLMALVALWTAWVAWRRHEIATDRRLLQVLVLTTPMGFIALEAGWVVTEVGRQPWIVTGVLRTADAVTPMPGLQYTLIGFSLLYLMLAWVVSRLLYGLIVQVPADTEWHREYRPPASANA
ncbi:MAG TPA: cytochrome ubiquinol oxidase subunit I [Gemmatimonadales bacterium]|nr:cytochrome ubiquinol oxidase subunit I [Gemmatimonadales bacterium]